MQEVNHLNRTLRWTPRGIEYETDHKHVKAVLEALGPVGVKVKTPFERVKIEDRDMKLLPVPQAVEHRSLAMRIGYLGQDRVDLQRAVRELSMGLAQPTEYHWKCLKRVGRYLRHAPTWIQMHTYAESMTHLEVFCDADHAGCLRTRKSMTGVVMTMAGSIVRSYC